MTSVTSSKGLLFQDDRESRFVREWANWVQTSCVLYTPSVHIAFELHDCLWTVETAQQSFCCTTFRSINNNSRIYESWRKKLSEDTVVAEADIKL